MLGGRRAGCALAQDVWHLSAITDGPDVGEARDLEGWLGHHLAAAIQLAGEGAHRWVGLVARRPDERVRRDLAVVIQAHRFSGGPGDAPTEHEFDPARLQLRARVGTQFGADVRQDAIAGVNQDEPAIL